MELGAFRCKFFFSLPPFVLAFFPRHAHKRTQINTVPRPLPVSVDASADSDSPPVPVSHLGTRARREKKKGHSDLSYLAVTLLISLLAFVSHIPVW